MNIPSRVADEDHLYIGNAGGREVKGTLYSMKAGANGDITPSEGNTVSSGVEWAALDVRTGNPPPLLYKRLICILGSRGGELECYEAATGKQIYKEKIRVTGFDFLEVLFTQSTGSGDRTIRSVFV